MFLDQLFVQFTYNVGESVFDRDIYLRLISLL